MGEVQQLRDRHARTKPVLREIVFGILAAVSVPFVITGLFRILPFTTPTWVPFVLIAVATLGLWRLRIVPTAVLIGVGAGLVTHAGFLLWLFSMWSVDPVGP
ncbi:MAG: hypothetical protein M3N53_06420 [Actinomycetota bacterium]|nr:hypothetical protein [Actinomycetota bacterium]